MRRWLSLELGILALCVVGFATLLLRHLSYPLLWQDEAETAMFATRILEYGFPKVHGERNVVYEFGPNIALGLKESVDAYIGTTWGHFYFAVPGVWWAEGTEDPHAKTARVRLPFALAGLAAIASFAWLAVPALLAAPRSSDRGNQTHRRALRFAALVFALSATSVSLQLHLREARYYPLLVLLVGSLLALQVRFAVLDRLGARAYTLGVALLLFALFHTYFAGFFVCAALLGLHAAWSVRDAAADARVSTAHTLLAPLFLAGIAVAPFLVFFETAKVVTRFAEHVGTSPAGYLENVRALVLHLARQELLVPTLAARLAAVALARRRSSAGEVWESAALQRTAAALAGFALGYAALVCLNPLVYERYFTVLGPLLSVVFLLDAFSLVHELPRSVPERARRRTAVLAGAACAAVVGASVAARAPELAGRFAELRAPYRGPIDFAIAHLREAYADTEPLVIATNYAAHPFMYYLGSHVIVGTSLNNITRERELVPDVVIPRRRWPRGHQELRRFLGRGGYAPFPLPVDDRHFNNVPELARTAAVPDPHRFRTPRPATPEDRLVVYRRTAARSDTQ